MRFDARRSRRFPVIRPAALAAAALGVGFSLAGCQSSLFRRNDARTQFDRYDKARNRYEPAYIEDEYGRLTPNLRGRLLTND